MDRAHSVQVAASTSNLGPGFDFLGLCLDLPLEASIRAGTAGHPHRVEYAHDVSWTDEDDLALKAIACYESRFETTLPSAVLRIESAIPVGRGFGSSGAAVAAALLLAAAFDGADIDERRTELVELALAVEGHPDNGTASLFGGCTLAVPTDRGVTVIRQDVHDSIAFAVAWPRDPLPTERARAALPRDVPFASAVENPRRLALLLEGLRTGDADLLALGVVDHLHERLRRALIPGSEEACAAAREAGAHAACLSGAGSGLVALGPHGAMDDIARALASPLEGGRSRVVDFVARAPEIRAQ
ncbi:MAG: homoserine kinase [Planctomycetota bacterium]